MDIKLFEAFDLQRYSLLEKHSKTALYVEMCQISMCESVLS